MKQLAPKLNGLFRRAATSGEGAIRDILPGLVRRRYRHPLFEARHLAKKLARAARIAKPGTLASIVTANVEVHGVDMVEAALENALTALGDSDRVQARCHLLQGAMRALPAFDRQPAIRLGESYVEVVDSSEVAELLAKLEIGTGEILRPIQLLERGDGLRSCPLYAQLKTHARLLSQGMTFKAHRQRPCQPQSDRRILYFVNQCQPHHSSGYAIRTQWMIRSLLARGWDVGTYARFGYPTDRSDFEGVDEVANHADVDGISYTFSPARNGYRNLDGQAYHDAAVETLMRQVERFRPALIHTASNYIVGLAGTEAAKRAGIPSIYEMRGLWHMTRASTQPAYDHSDHYQMSQLLEIQAANSADHVFTITDAIRDVVLAAGISPDKVSVVPNAVDSDRFTPSPRDERLAAKFALANQIVIGYVGSFSAYEGLDYLLQAAAMLRARCDVEFRVLLVGDGVAYDGLVELASELGVRDIVTFTGRVSYQEIGAYYSLIDIVTYSRKGDRVCELVSPLKPYEAMAMEKAVVVSDVDALASMVQHEKTGLVHRRDDVGSLAAVLETLLVDEHLRTRLGKEGRYWVTTQRTWARVATMVDEVYRDLIGRGCYPRPLGSVKKGRPEGTSRRRSR